MLINPVDFTQSHAIAADIAGLLLYLFVIYFRMAASVDITASWNDISAKIATRTQSNRGCFFIRMKAAIC
jgi:hypothetical protein